ncbi:MAG: Hsp20/alpha crystallin family protein [Candidatus Gracilibacteria bacterium]|nr:Hsp20/alpha crystallin family protein [Candidatus Gracilibacteria bacterium]
MFKMFNVTNSDEVNSTSLEVKMEDGDIIESEVGQVALDILDHSSMVVIIAPLAGMDTDNIDISVSRNILTISGERKYPDIYEEADRLLVQECFFGPFSRSVILPENLAFNRIKATMEDNLLRVEIPKLSFSEKTVKINKLEG